MGLYKSFDKMVYCSEITKNLCIKILNVNPNNIVSLPMNKKVEIPNSFPKTYVTLLNANHCPGAVMFLFDTNGMYQLHVGDFRAEYQDNSQFVRDNKHILTEYRNRITNLYLDTTYCDIKKTFPSQQNCINFIVNECKKYMHKNKHRKICILVGTYSIGKERILEGIAKELPFKINISYQKEKYFRCIYNNNDFNKMYTTNWVNNSSNITVTYMNEINNIKMKKWLDNNNYFDTIVGFKPTGWTLKNKLNDGNYHIKPKTYYGNKIIIYEIPYSEHSSFTELYNFVDFIQPKNIIPTVNNRKQFNTNKQISILTSKQNINLKYGKLLLNGHDKSQTHINQFFFKI